MDAAHDVALEPQIPVHPEEALKTAERLREEIQTTSKVLHQHVEDLREHLKGRLKEYRDPLGVHEWIDKRPLTGCGLALLAGIGCGVFRSVPSSTRLISKEALGLSTGVLRGVGLTCGNTIGAMIASRFLGRS